MKISKMFEIGITGKFQPYKFSTSAEIEISDKSNIDKESDKLFSLCLKSTLRDIENLAAEDEEFNLVLTARKEELNKYRKYLSNVKKNSEEGNYI